MMFSVGPDGWPVLYGIIGVLYMVFWIYTLIDVVRSTFKDSTMKIIWVLIILVAQVLGPILYWLLAERQKV